MAILPKAIKLPMTFFTELEQTIQKFICNHNSPRLQAILQSHSNQDSVVLVPNRHTGQWNRIENPEINPNNQGQLIFDKGGKNIK